MASKMAAAKNPYITFGKRSRERTASERKRRKYGDVLVKGEERGRGARCVRAVTLPAAPRARGGTDDASALGGEGYPATHLLYQGDVAVATT